MSIVYAVASVSILKWTVSPLFTLMSVREALDRRIAGAVDIPFALRVARQRVLARDRVLHRQVTRTRRSCLRSWA